MELTCARQECGRRFRRALSEHHRSVRLGRSEYCSQTCQVAVGNHLAPRGSHDHLAKGSDPDRFSPFRSYMASIRSRDPSTDITLEYLYDIWNQQDGRCPLTGWNLRLPRTTGNRGPAVPTTASIDRIDPRLGYRRGNVRWLAYIANLARASFTDEDVHVFARAVAARAPS